MHPNMNIFGFIFFFVTCVHSTSEEDLKEEINTLRNELNELKIIKQELGHLQAKDGFFEEQLHLMAEFYREEVATLKDKIHMQEQRVAELQIQCAPPRQDGQDPPLNGTDLLPFSLGTKVNESSYFVAFSAFPSAPKTYQDGQRLVFDQVLANAGKWYSEGSGIFMCPLDGYYMFSVVLFNDFLSDIHVQLMVDTRVVFYKILMANELSASHHAIVKCKQLQPVFLMAFRFTFNLSGNPEMAYSSFSGQLLKAGF